MKTCTKCGLTKEFSEFPKQKTQKDGYRPRCKKCHNADSKEYVLKNKEKVLARSKNAYYKDVEKSRKQCLNSYYKHHDARKESSAINARKYWSEKTPEEKFQHGLKHRERQLKWKRDNKDSVAYHLAQRRAALLNATPKWLTKDQKKEIAQFYKTARIMSEFHEERYEVDHIEPLKGKISSGLNVPWNLAVILAADNRKKSNKITI